MFKYALSLILRRKLRTMLTSLGIMIAVMLMTFILFGMTDLQRAVLTQFSSVFKPTDLYVSSQDLMFGGMLSAPTKQEEEKKEPVIVNERVKKEIEIHKEATCDACSGKGSKSGKMQACVACAGSGHVGHSQGFFVIQTTCPRCHGAGEFVSDPCDECRGNGKVRKKKSLSVKVPPGVENGMHLVLRGEGNAGAQGGPGGDLYVEVHVAPHDFFERKGDDIYCTVPVVMAQAALGIKIPVPTLEGTKEIEIPEGCDSGEEIRLKKMGFPNVQNGRRGDQIIKVVVKKPKKMSKKQRQLLEEFLKS